MPSFFFFVQNFIYFKIYFRADTFWYSVFVIIKIKGGLISIYEVCLFYDDFLCTRRIRNRHDD